MSKGNAYEFLSSRLDDVAPERYPAFSVRIISAAAMEEYSSLKLSEYKEKLKAEIEKKKPVERDSEGNFTMCSNCYGMALNDVLTLIDKI